MNILYRQAGQIRHVAFIVFMISVVIVIMIATFISGTVVKPIQALAKAMDAVGNNHMEVKFIPRYNDEIAYLGKKFSDMVQKIVDLMTEVKHTEEQKRVEELKALQAQINPHFLYNTLDTVYWMNKMDGNDNAADLVMDLADFFRLSLNKGGDITTVRNELEHVRKYMEIQRVRMEDRFDYEILCKDESLLECRVIKLILQPFAENALLHGFDNLLWQGKITIEAKKEEENILFYITDMVQVSSVNLGVQIAGDSEATTMATLISNPGGNVRETLEDLSKRYNDGLYEQARIDEEKANVSEVKIGFQGKIMSVEGFDPKYSIQAEKIKYLTADEWKALQN